ncbi:MAG: cysteine--tRNA ligase [Mycobacteriales bacterium]
MSLRLYDTRARQVRDFVPLRAGEVSIYLCGATVQSPPHLGHLRSGVNVDVLRRWLAQSGYEVTLIRNVTDIDDKILANAAAQDVPWWRIAYANERAFSWGYDRLNCLPPSNEPRATGHVPEMIALMRRLIDGGHAYAADGNVYFDVRSFPAYGSLSGQKVSETQQGETAATGKRDPLDFTLWKAAKPGEPWWETPWGEGRPGWHLECSAMATRYLGPEFDIHGGGLDLVFPHHENELAQSAAAGDPFARYWFHHGLLNLSGEKMSKSIGNTLAVPAVLARVPAPAVRYYLAAPHYRSTIDFSEEALAEAAAAYGRIEGFVTRAVELLGTGVPVEEVPKEFAEAMDDDLGTPQAVAVLHDAVREGNRALAAGERDAVAVAYGEVSAMAGVLGVHPLDGPWAGARGGDDLRTAVDGLVALALEQRERARARRDYAAADAIRDQLKDAGVAVEDTPNGPRWQIGH